MHSNPRHPCPWSSWPVMHVLVYNFSKKDDIKNLKTTPSQASKVDGYTLFYFSKWPILTFSRPLRSENGQKRDFSTKKSDVSSSVASNIAPFEKVRIFIKLHQNVDTYRYPI